MIMEPDVVQLYSSSPPPLDDGGDEEDEDDFGEFGGYCCNALSSFSFSEFDSPVTFGQASPPDLNDACVQNQSGKGPVHEEVGKLQRASKSGEKLEACEGTISPSDPKPELLVVSKMEQHRFPSTTEQRDSESSSTSREGRCLIDEQSKCITRTDQEASVVTSCNSTETVVALGSDLGPEGSTAEAGQPSAFLDALLVEREESEFKYTGAKHVLTESKDVRDNTPGGKQRNEEGLEKDGKKEVSSLGQDSFEDVESPESDGTVDGLEGFVNVTMSSFRKMLAEENEVPMVGTGMDVEDKEANQAVMEPTVNVIHDDKFISKDKASSVSSVMDEDEDFGDFSDAAQDITDSSQKVFTDFVTAQSGCSTDDEFEDMDTLKDLKQEEMLGNEQEDGYNGQELQSSELAPSDSFADFSSAPFGGLAHTDGGGWAAFGTHEEREVQQESWAAFDEQSSPATVPSTDGLKTEKAMDGPNHKVQRLFESMFSSAMRSEDSEVPSLHTLLHPDYPRESREDVALWRHLLDIHSARGLKVQWVGSRSNRILLDCLGIRNILFIGQNKQPVVVPMFAAGLGMLEPTKDPAKPSSTFSASSPSQARSTLCAQVVSSLNLGDDAPLDTTNHINLDFFGPVEDSSSDSDTETPMPGLDPDLYELTTAKQENNDGGSNIAEAFNKLMESAEKNSTVKRRPERDDDISKEAAHILSLLPDLSFMYSSVLMFPSTLTP